MAVASQDSGEDLRPLKKLGSQGLRNGLLYATFFLLGALASGQIGSFLGDSPTALLVPYLLATIILTLVVITFARDSHNIVVQQRRYAREELRAQLSSAQEAFRTALSEAEKQSVIVFEQDFDDRVQENRCYEKMIELVDNARRSVFVIPNPYRRDAVNESELIWRDNFLRAIERKIGTMHRDDRAFEYIRIQQVGPDYDGNLRAHVGRMEWAHLERLKDIPYGKKRLMTIDRNQTTGQIIIDEEIFVNLITAVDSKGRKRLVAIAVMKDPSSQNIKEYYEQLRNGLLLNAKTMEI